MKYLTIITFVILLSSCGSEQAQAPKAEVKEKTSTMFDTQMDALDKAKGVEQSLQEFEQQRREKMEENGI